MSDFICSECGMTKIDCGGDGFKTPKEIDLEKKVHILNEANMYLENVIGKLCEQLKEANEIIANFRTYDFTRDDELAEEYQVKYGIEGKKIYTNKKPPKEIECLRKKITNSLKKKLKSEV